MCFRTSVLYGDVGVIRVCIVGANGRTCCFFFGRGGEMGCFEVVILVYECWCNVSISCWFQRPRAVLFLVVCVFWRSVVGSWSCSYLLFYISKLLRIGVLFVMVVFPSFIVGADGLVPSRFRWFVLFICYVLFIESIKIVVIDGRVYIVTTFTTVWKTYEWS